MPFIPFIPLCVGPFSGPEGQIAWFADMLTAALMASATVAVRYATFTCMCMVCSRAHHPCLQVCGMQSDWKAAHGPDNYLSSSRRESPRSNVQLSHFVQMG